MAPSTTLNVPIRKKFLSKANQPITKVSAVSMPGDPFYLFIQTGFANRLEKDAQSKRDEERKRTGGS